MASTWYRGGIEAFNNLANAWTGNQNHYVSVLEGTTIPNTNKNHTTLSQLMSDIGNPNYLGSEVSIDGIKTISFDIANRYYLLRFTNQLNFGPVTAATDMAGVVYYSGTATGRADAANATVWATQESYASAGGGDVKFGTNTDNIALYFECMKSPVSGGGSNTLSPFKGTLSALQELANYWTGQPDKVLGYALIRNTNLAEPDPQWEFMSELDSAGVVYVTGGEPANTPVTTISTHRQTPAFDGNFYDYNIWSETIRTPVTWPSGTITVGETIAAVVVFMYDSDLAYSPSTARIIHWDNVTDYTIQAATDVTYMQASNTTINSIQMM